MQQIRKERAHRAFVTYRLRTQMRICLPITARVLHPSSISCAEHGLRLSVEEIFNVCLVFSGVLLCRKPHTDQQSTTLSAPNSFSIRKFDCVDEPQRISIGFLIMQTPSEIDCPSGAQS